MKYIARVMYSSEASGGDCCLESKGFDSAKFDGVKLDAETSAYCAAKSYLDEGVLRGITKYSKATTSVRVWAELFSLTNVGTPPPPVPAPTLRWSAP